MTPRYRHLAALGTGILFVVLVQNSVSWRAEAAEREAAAAPAQMHSMHHAMTQDEMQRWVNDWYTKHPVRGVNATVAPVDTFLTGNNFFDSDNKVTTVVDTVRISVGQTILWRLLAGIHTTTSGTGSGDPAAGMLFDQPLDANHTSFAFTFNQAGTFPFFCRPHEIFNMKGVVIVRKVSGVEPIAEPDGSLGWVEGPFPNPTAGGASFRFALRQRGAVRVEVFDVLGRRVAVPVNEELPAGVYSGSWDGRTRVGQAPAGTYYLRLHVPGREEKQRLVVLH
jgi:plastocyanin